MHRILGREIYTVPTGSNPTSVSSEANIELRTDTLKLRLPLDSKNNVKPINFGGYGAHHTGYLTAKETANYVVEVIDDRVNKTPNWSLSLQANEFKQTKAGGSTASVNAINLGILDSSTQIFNGIIGSPMGIAQGTGDSSLDIITGNGSINTNFKVSYK